MELCNEDCLIEILSQSHCSEFFCYISYTAYGHHGLWWLNTTAYVNQTALLSSTVIPLWTPVVALRIPAVYEAKTAKYEQLLDILGSVCKV